MWRYLYSFVGVKPDKDGSDSNVMLSSAARPARGLPLRALCSRLAQLGGVPVLRGGGAVVPHGLPRLLPHAPVQAAGEDALHQLAADGERPLVGVRAPMALLCFEVLLLLFRHSSRTFEAFIIFRNCKFGVRIRRSPVSPIDFFSQLFLDVLYKEVNHGIQMLLTRLSS